MCSLSADVVRRSHSSAPQITIWRSSYSYSDFSAWFERYVTGKHLRTIIWIAQIKLSFVVLICVHTGQNTRQFEWSVPQMIIQILHCALVWKPSKIFINKYWLIERKSEWMNELWIIEWTEIISGRVDAFNPFSTGTGWTLYKVYGGFRISYGMG